MPRVGEIDRLIEEGLTLYGQGDLDGALLQWERALAIDPDNAQANSYVDYVRSNYELLTNDANGEATTEGAPFGIANDDPEYQIEIQPGEIKASVPTPSTPSELEPIDEGWTIDEEVRDRVGGPPGISLDPFELEPEQPPAKQYSTVRGLGGVPREPEDFDDATREWNKRDQARHPPPDTGGFEAERTPAPPSEFAPIETPAFGQPSDYITPPGFGTQTTGIKQREDLGFVQPTATPESPPKPAPGMGATFLGLPARPRTPASPSEPPEAASQLDELTLEPESAPPKKSTKDFPQQQRKPALATAKPPASALDFDSKTTERPVGGGQQLDPLISAPTRDLGLREVAAAHHHEMATSREGTRADVVLPFDPIDARATEILEDVDETAPANEPKEDQTRRRITTLFEKAAQWANEGELERAVAAVDLAMSEDPNAALAQKLIHRNRETIMNVFQTYLGDLERTPQLARPLHELANAPISPRAAFLLSRIDGMLSIDEILDVCGMPRLEAYRYLCQLFLRGILR